MAAPVFISHSSRDRSIAQTLCRALEQRNLACWISARDIGPGQNFQEAIVRALTGAKVMVLVFSANANESDEIKKELALASQNRLAVVPVRVEDVLPTDAFKYELATRQWIDVFADWERAVGDLANHIRGIIEDLPVDTRPAMPAPAPREQLPAWPLAAGIAVVVAGGAASWYLGLFSGPRPTALTGAWKSGEMTNPYDQNEKFTLTFKFDQTSDQLSGTVTEAADGRGGATRGIVEGHIVGPVVTFFTQGQNMVGDSVQPYKETYRGTVDGDHITFLRQNDAISGGLPENFTATRQ